MDSDATSSRPLLVVNPLPKTLSHYRDVLASSVGPPVAGARLIEPDIEVGDLPTPRRLLARVRALKALVVAALARDCVLVLWPSFGLADLAIWRASSLGARRLVVVHDPVPLRRQVGYGRVGSRLGRWGSRGVEVVAHTRLAARSLESNGIVVSHVLPHPALPPGSRSKPPGRPVVRVLGQYKGSRDLAILEAISDVAPPDWTLEILGRGWPPVAGWDVTDEFLSEAELREAFVSSSAILLPYKHYFQSGIVTRAYEEGVPVVAARHEFVASLYGDNWPGLVDSDDPASWRAAIQSVTELAQIDLPDARDRGVREWRAALQGARRP